MRFIVVETNKQLTQETFTRTDAGKLFGDKVEICFPNGEFGFNTYINAGYQQLNETTSPAKYQVVMNNDVVLFNQDFMTHMINGLRSVSSASPLGLREATWGLVNRSVAIDVNRSVNGWFLMFDKKILNAISFEQLFPVEFTWYNGDIHYAKKLQNCGYKHGLINAAQSLHLQKQSHPLRNDGYRPPTDRNTMLKIIGIKGKRCAEIGVEQGHFAKIIMAEEPSSLLLVDPWSHQENPLYIGDMSNVDDTDFEKYFQEVQQALGKDQRVNICRTLSVQAAKLVEDKSLDFVYIDACHAKEAVLEDMYCWFPKVVQGGWLCGHDYQHPPVSDAVKDFCAKENIKLTFVTQENGPATSWGIKVTR
jgi:hypothetical protein